MSEHFKKSKNLKKMLRKKMWGLKVILLVLQIEEISLWSELSSPPRFSH